MSKTRPCRPKNTLEFRTSPSAVEPVKRLPRSHKTKTGGGQAGFFGRAADAGKISHPPEMFLSRKAHGIVRLHGKNRIAIFEKQFAENPRTRADVRYWIFGPQEQFASAEIQNRLRISRSGSDVILNSIGKPLRRIEARLGIRQITPLRASRSCSPRALRPRGGDSPCEADSFRSRSR